MGTHHNGVAQVLAEGERTRFVWVSDLLPEEMADRTGELMELGSTTVKKTLEAG